jgi:uncharacterized BrkB/YihY/UPF0761 family membrane protein
MSSLTLRRAFVWVVGMILGFVVGAVIVSTLHLLVPNGEPISIEKYGYMYFLVTAVPIGLIFVFWLDYFMDTRIMPD